MGEILTGVNVATSTISNMTVDTIYVAPDAVSYILNTVRLSISEQEAAVDELVDRTKNWLELSQEERTDKIHICLIEATVVKQMISSGTIKDDCTAINVGMRADDGAIVIEAMYVRMNRKERRAWTKRSKEITRRRQKTIKFDRGNDDE